MIILFTFVDFCNIKLSLLAIQKKGLVNLRPPTTANKRKQATQLNTARRWWGVFCGHKTVV